MRLKNARIILPGGRDGLIGTLSDQLSKRGAVLRTAGPDKDEDISVD